jgi:hypothetical protein
MATLAQSPSKCNIAAVCQVWVEPHKEDKDFTKYKFVVHFYAEFPLKRILTMRSGGRSVCIVHSRTQAMEFSSF